MFLEVLNFLSLLVWPTVVSKKPQIIKNPFSKAARSNISKKLNFIFIFPSKNCNYASNLVYYSTS